MVSVIRFTVFICSLMQAFVCFSACLFTLRLSNVVREIVRTNHYHSPSNTTCTDFCTVPVSVVWCGEVW